MTVNDAIIVIDKAKNKSIDPVEMLNLIWLRVIVSQITKDEWDVLIKRALPILSK